MTWCCGAGGVLVVVAVLLVTALVVGAVALSKSLLDRRASSGGGPSRGIRSIEILEQRYSRGEIDADEFEERRRAVDSHRSDG